MNQASARQALTKRQARLLNQLIQAPTMRESCDRIAGASNAPEIVRQLRQKGLHIRCERVQKTDRDGHATFPGCYSLAPESRAAALHLLGECHDRA